MVLHMQENTPALSGPAPGFRSEAQKWQQEASRLTAELLALRDAHSRTSARCQSLEIENARLSTLVAHFQEKIGTSESMAESSSSQRQKLENLVVRQLCDVEAEKSRTLEAQDEVRILRCQLTEAAEAYGEMMTALQDIDPGLVEHLRGKAPLRKPAHLLELENEQLRSQLSEATEQLNRRKSVGEPTSPLTPSRRSSRVGAEAPSRRSSFRVESTSQEKRVSLRKASTTGDLSGGRPSLRRSSTTGGGSQQRASTGHPAIRRASTSSVVAV